MTAAVTAVSELGATVVEQEGSEIPWEGGAEVKPKPWENKGAPKAPAKVEGAKPASINW